MFTSDNPVNLYRVLSVGGALEAEKYKKRRQTLGINDFSDMIERIVEEEGFKDHQERYSDEAKYDEELLAQWTDHPEGISPYIPMGTDDFLVVEADIDSVLDYHNEESLDSLDNREHSGYYGYRVDFVPLESVELASTSPNREQQVSSRLDSVDVVSPNAEDWGALDFSERNDEILDTLN